MSYRTCEGCQDIHGRIEEAGEELRLLIKILYARGPLSLSQLEESIYDLSSSLRVHFDPEVLPNVERPSAHHMFGAA